MRVVEPLGVFFSETNKWVIDPCQLGQTTGDLNALHHLQICLSCIPRGTSHRASS